MEDSMKQRIFAVVLVPYLAVWSVWLMQSTAFAQSMPVLSQQQVYTTADPVRPGAIGIATPDGRYAVSMSDRCGEVGVGPDMNVELWLYEGFSGIGTIALLNQDGLWDDTNWCGIRFEQRMDTTPCFMNADGICDVALEYE
jgi:hypothetical protein